MRSVTTSGSQYYVTGNGAGTIALNGDLIAGSGVTPPANSAGNDIQIVGNAVASATNLTMATNGTISGGEVLISGTLTGDTNSLALNAGQGLIVLGGTVLQNPAGSGSAAVPLA